MIYREKNCLMSSKINRKISTKRKLDKYIMDYSNMTLKYIKSIIYLGYAY